jgi:hypothetical protein
MMIKIQTTRRLRANSIFTAIVVLLSPIANRATSQETATETPLVNQNSAAATPSTDTPPAPPKLAAPTNAQRLSPMYDVWIDPKQKAVLVDGQVSLREGMLEMFACTRNTKEHESIVSANTKAFLVHAALLRVGAEPGQPVRFVPVYRPQYIIHGFFPVVLGLPMDFIPMYRPPEGMEIEVFVQWLDERGSVQTTRAQEWIKDIRTGKAMTHTWVFAGSRFWTDEETGQQYYQAEGGDFICVSNFGSAMLDIPIESSQTNQELAFEAFSERIPPLGAPVRLILKPKLKEPSPTRTQPATTSRIPATKPAQTAEE